MSQEHEDGMVQVLRAHRRRIDDHGWTVVGSPPEGGDSAHAYTVGLSRFRDHPEIIISVARLGGAHLLLDELGEHVRRGHDFLPLDEVRLGDGHGARLVDGVAEGWVPLAQLLCGAPCRPVRVLQLVIADAAGRWPGDRAYAPGLWNQQVFDRPPGFTSPMRR